MDYTLKRLRLELYFAAASMIDIHNTEHDFSTSCIGLLEEISHYPPLARMALRILSSFVAAVLAESVSEAKSVVRLSMLLSTEKAGGFSRRPSGAFESMVASDSENRSVTSEKGGGLEVGVFARSSDSR
jgi:hypothetical protein